MIIEATHILENSSGCYFSEPATFDNEFIIVLLSIYLKLTWYRYLHIICSSNIMKLIKVN